MASGGAARGRLAEERKAWRKSHPLVGTVILSASSLLLGFVAKPAMLPDGSVNLMLWNCVVPGKEGKKNNFSLLSQNRNKQSIIRFSEFMSGILSSVQQLANQLADAHFARPHPTIHTSSRSQMPQNVQSAMRLRVLSFLWERMHIRIREPLDTGAFSVAQTRAATREMRFRIRPPLDTNTTILLNLLLETKTRDMLYYGNHTIKLFCFLALAAKRGLTDWEGGYFPVTLHFTENYPSNPPTCKFPRRFFHVNVYDSGDVCLSILGDAWAPSITVRQILIGIQELLENPNPASPAQDFAYDVFAENMPEYKRRVREQAKRYPSLV
ncbi:Ubiquitin-conjugating enzyme E2 I [Zea mays]|uniref:Ubiquitin-conjugating enzyme E2 I n=1 Tax=Zea mays TaxID=4577 RepID=A0A1D6E1Y7_MAIZE|nr:Ubiquitin-conjugating enzyme E2 I [Zea mays]